MKSFRLARLFVLTALLALATSVAHAQGTGFSYQGRLTDGGTPANGAYDLRFKLYDAATAGALQGSPNTVTASNVTVTNGVFTVQLDFGNTAFTGGNRYLEIEARAYNIDPNTPAYTLLAPRQQITRSPYAIQSLSAANLRVETVSLTPSVAGLTVLVLNYTGTSTVTDLTGGVDGQCVVLIVVGSTTTINNGSNFRLNGGTWTGTADNSLTVCRYNNLWYEAARSNPATQVLNFSQSAAKSPTK